MNTTRTTNERLNEEIAKLDWQIDDAKRELSSAAKAFARRAEEAVTQCDAMMADQPCGFGWISFAEGDLRRAREAKHELDRLIDKQKTLKYIARND